MFIQLDVILGLEYRAGSLFIRFPKCRVFLTVKYLYIYAIPRVLGWLSIVRERMFLCLSNT